LTEEVAGLVWRGGGGSREGSIRQGVSHSCRKRQHRLNRGKSRIQRKGPTTRIQKNKKRGEVGKKGTAEKA